MYNEVYSNIFVRSGFISPFFVATRVYRFPGRRLLSGTTFDVYKNLLINVRCYRKLQDRTHEWKRKHLKVSKNFYAFPRSPSECLCHDPDRLKIKDVFVRLFGTYTLV